MTAAHHIFNTSRKKKDNRFHKKGQRYNSNQEIKPPKKPCEQIRN